MNIKVKAPPLADNVKAGVMLSLAQILQPITRKWTQEISHGPNHLSEGLEKARNDLQTLIDDALKRSEVYFNTGSDPPEGYRYEPARVYIAHDTLSGQSSVWHMEDPKLPEPRYETESLYRRVKL